MTGIRVDATSARRREESDTYPVVLALDADWRIIECRDGIQWILQRRTSRRHGQPRWEGRCYCRTRNGLIARVRASMGDRDPNALAALERLPARIGQVCLDTGAADAHVQ